MANLKNMCVTACGGRSERPCRIYCSAITEHFKTKSFTVDGYVFLFKYAQSIFFSFTSLSLLPPLVSRSLTHPPHAPQPPSFPWPLSTPLPRLPSSLTCCFCFPPFPPLYRAWPAGPPFLPPLTLFSKLSSAILALASACLTVSGDG